jgi:hypothetical protein
MVVFEGCDEVVIVVVVVVSVVEGRNREETALGSEGR